MFREQALTQRFKRDSGYVFELQPARHNLIVAAVLITLFAITYFISTTQFAKKEKVSGFISSSKGIVKILPSQGGIVTELHVQPGDYVKKNQLLITLRKSMVLESGGDLKKKVANLYTHQFDLVSQSLELTYKQEANRKISRDLQLRHIREQLAQVESSIELQYSSLGELQEQKERMQQLFSKNFISRISWTNLVLQISQEHQKLNNLQQQKLQFKQERDRLNDRLNAEALQTDSGKLKLESDYTQLLTDRFAFLGQEHQELRTPVNGYITNLLVSRGTHVNTSRPLIHILPEDTQLDVTLFIPDRAIAFIKKDQTAEFSIQGLPHQHFGSLTGKINYVTSNLVTPAETNFPINPTESVYLVKALFESHAIKKFGPGILLKPGMLLTADIKLENRTLLEWILEPLKAP